MYEHNDYGMPLPEEMQMAADVSNKLMQCYPGYPWMVNADIVGGLVTIQLDFSGRWGCTLYWKTVEHDRAEMKEVMRAGGELLERFRLKRGVADEVQIYNMPVDFTGLPQPAL